MKPVRYADLFAGCGGMSVGLAEAGRRSGVPTECALAIDADADIVEIYRRNFGAPCARTADIAEMFSGAIGEPLTEAETAIAEETQAVQMLQGGPPCQGHSDLNNHTRRKDPKNALYLRMARAAEVLGPDIVVIENVAPVQWDKSDVVSKTREALESLGYAVSAKVLNLQRLGVPQRRRRFVMLASKLATLNPATVFSALSDAWDDHPARSVEWAIRDLLEVKASSTFDTPSHKSPDNAKRMAYLFEHGCYNLPNEERPVCHQDGDHSYVSVYGRLRWDQPAQTITTGFGSMGQGRYVHPQRRRTITPHEAARLQTFPDWFDFGEDTRRGVLAKVIGNAVPPLMMTYIGQLILPAIAASVAERLRA